MRYSEEAHDFLYAIGWELLTDLWAALPNRHIGLEAGGGTEGERTAPVIELYYSEFWAPYQVRCFVHNGHFAVRLDKDCERGQKKVYEMADPCSIEEAIYTFVRLAGTADLLTEVLRRDRQDRREARRRQRL